MSTEKYRIERFIFPDGQSVELMVFDETRRRTSAPPAPIGPTTAVPATGAATTGPETTVPPAPIKTAPSPCCVPPPPRDDLAAHKCPVCGGELVYPEDWDRAGKVSWTLKLRCPECETRREVTVGRAAVERFNRELYFGAQALAREAEQLTRRNFEEEVDRIVAALERDLILPMDF